MFRSNQYNTRYEHAPIQLDTPIAQPGNATRQMKSGYQFTLNDRSSYFDWYNAYFEISFQVNKLADGAAFAAADEIALINDAASLINQMQVRQNGKIVYDGNNLHRFVNVKSLLEISDDYVKTTGTNEYFYLDTTAAAESRDDQAGYNSGFAIRHALIITNQKVDSMIPLNKYSFFGGLETNMLPPSQIQISLQLADDNVLIFKAGGDDGRVVINKLVLWIPRMIFNPDGLSYVMTNHMTSTTWTYLREMIQESGSTQLTESVFRITAGVKNPKHVFVYLQRADKSSSQTQNPHLLDTFKLNAADANCYLQSARLEVGNGVYYPETEYSYDNIIRIFGDAINYSHKQNDKNTGTLLNVSNFKNLFGMIYFDLSYKGNEVSIDPKQLSLRYKLNNVPTARYKVYSLVLYKEEVVIETVENELVIV